MRHIASSSVETLRSTGKNAYILGDSNDMKELISKHINSIIVISYRNMGYPSIEEIKNILSEFKPLKDIYIVNLGEYSYALNRSRTKANEYLIIGR